MAAIRTVYESLWLVASDKQSRTIVLDCWRITIYLWTDGPGNRMEGAAANQDGWLVSPGIPTPLSAQVFQLGGMVLDGKPVYLNDRIQFDNIAQSGGGGNWYGWCIKEYYDTNTPHPGT